MKKSKFYHKIFWVDRIEWEPSEPLIFCTIILKGAPYFVRFSFLKLQNKGPHCRKSFIAHLIEKNEIFNAPGSIVLFFF